MEHLIPANAPIRSELLGLTNLIGMQLAEWLESKFLSCYGKNWWQQCVVKVLSDRHQQRIESGEWSALADFDLGGLINIQWQNRRLLTKHRKLDKSQYDLISAAREDRNYCEGHWPTRGMDSVHFSAHLKNLAAYSSFLGKKEKIRQAISDIEKSIYAFDANDSANVNQPDTTASSKVQPFTSKLESHFSNIQLTGSQQQAINKLQDFFNDQSLPCFQLKGYAGTGKTFIIGQLVRYLNSQRINVCLLAPTGRAAHVL